MDTAIISGATFQDELWYRLRPQQNSIQVKDTPDEALSFGGKRRKDAETPDMPARTLKR
jgi:hypothetical protein